MVRVCGAVVKNEMKNESKILENEMKNSFEKVK